MEFEEGFDHADLNSARDFLTAFPVIDVDVSIARRAGRVLGLVERLDLFVPVPAPSPMEQLKREGKRRKRASGTPRASASPGPWRWGEES